MPTATDKLRNAMRLRFGSSVDHYGPYRFLMDAGFKDDKGIIRLPRPDYAVTVWEWDCIDFLCQEWDYGYDTDYRNG